MGFGDLLVYWEIELEAADFYRDDDVRVLEWFLFPREASLQNCTNVCVFLGVFVKQNLHIVPLPRLNRIDQIFLKLNRPITQLIQHRIFDGHLLLNLHINITADIKWGAYIIRPLFILRCAMLVGKKLGNV